MMLLYNDDLKERVEEAHKLSMQLESQGLESHMSFASRLSYLDTYACHGDKSKSRAVLFPDFAPYSFAFCIYALAKPGKGLTKADWIVREHPELEGYAVWFNGGLIFHGKHDNGGDGGMPTLSVNLSPVDGWGVHT